MPQFYQQKKGQARVRILPKDAMRGYLLLMQKTGGKIQSLSEDRYIIDESLLAELNASGIAYERLDEKKPADTGGNTE
jgi:hypothetical protein